MNKLIIVLIAVMLAAVQAGAQEAKEGKMALLAVREVDGSYEGSPAELSLIITPGTGRVFIESFPLTKIDTQISTRFAKEIVCSRFEGNCNDYDFFYTIRAKSTIVGGPSAGAAASVLTLALLEDLPMDQSVALTGTINSGELVGPVGGIVQKIEAASDIGIEMVLIPEGERFVEMGNKTVDVFEYGEELGIKVVEVQDLREAMFYFTGRLYERKRGDVSVDETYSEVMRELAEMLCERNKELASEAKETEGYEEIIRSAENLTRQAEEAGGEGNYYTMASRCFGANINTRYAILLSENYTENEINDMIAHAGNETDKFEESIPDYVTLTDLQSYSLVRERLDEARAHLESSSLLLSEGLVEDAVYQLTYGVERLYSAESWSKFIGKGSIELSLMEEDLEASCLSKLGEAEERYEYVNLFFPQALAGTRADLDMAYEKLENREYELCIFKASKAKAEANTLLSVLGVDEERVEDLLQAKLDATKENIIEQTEKGFFPIVGYSYYEYANSLKESDAYSSLLYSEYALELSNIDIYFDRHESSLPDEIKKPLIPLLFLLAGLLTGFAIAMSLSRRIYRKRRIIIRRKKR
ncbi:hypothetical protein JXB11_02710 [Candidatus Woesearchaeota archaeon]|nr:hypothetical protein [Candidatus Woesearchaeota archaeon]